MQPEHTEPDARDSPRQSRRALPRHAGARHVDRWARLHGIGPIVGPGAAVHRRHAAQQRLRHARQRDERAHPHRLHRHHRGRHVLRHHLRRHRPVGRLDGGADRRLRHPVDELALGPAGLVADGRGRRSAWASRCCSAPFSGWRTACSSPADASSRSSSRWARWASSAPT